MTVIETEDKKTPSNSQTNATVEVYKGCSLNIIIKCIYNRCLSNSM